MTPWIIAIIMTIASLLAMFTLPDRKTLLRPAILFSLLVFFIMAGLNYFAMIPTHLPALVTVLAFCYVLFYVLYGLIDMDIHFLPILVGVIIIIASLVAPLFMTKDLYALPGVTIAEDKPVQIDTEHLRQVNYDYARWKADKVIGELGNRVELDEMEIMVYNGRLTWVGPLVHRGFWKELSNDVTPGYVRLDGEDPGSDTIIETNYSMDYMYKGEYLNEYAKRILYRDYSPYKQFWAFEIDEAGSPWLVVSLALPTVWYTGHKVEKVLLFSPVNGSVQEFPFGQQPGWIDNAFPEELAEEYSKWWGKYKHGWWNAHVFSQKDVKHPTKKDGDVDVYMVLGSDGQTYWFTDFTSPSASDTSMVGYMLANTKTGEMTFYQANGILNGEAAMEAASAKVSNYQGWSAKQPMFLMLEGEEVWFSPIHSGTNILQKVSFIRAKTGEVVLVDYDETNYMGDLIREYQKLLDHQAVNLTTLHTGTILDIDSYVVDGETEWEMALDNGSATILVYAYADTRPHAYDVGDVVEISCIVDDAAYQRNVWVAIEIK